MAMKCMTQMPVPPMEIAAPANQRYLDVPSAPRARVVSSNPSMDPLADMTYASSGVRRPYEKCSIDDM
ncbi:hypothetical protein Ssi02_04630 [Sinosporangium siamense]|uniref:Uncharacterized protein n=1 Tax=Sinosporangium siamense TaxID=1367973 RepID=A0A919RAU8_9ACTN|nr:hypothetical protein Ssi02_04630 [Sinosporangium siamense]